MDQAASSAGINFSTLTYNSTAGSSFNAVGSSAVTIGSNYALDYLAPSVAAITTNTSPITYREFYRDWQIIRDCSNTTDHATVDVTNVDWTRMPRGSLQYTTVAGGGCTYTLPTVPLKSGGTVTVKGAINGNGTPNSISESIDANNDGKADNTEVYIVNTDGSKSDDVKNMNATGAIQNEEVINTGSGGQVTVNVSGSGATVTQSNAAITMAPGTDVTVAGSTDSVLVGGNGATSSTPIDTVRINGGTVTIRDGSRVDVKGDGNTVTAGSNDYFGVYGASETVNAKAGDGVWTGTNGASAPVIDNVNGAGITVTISDNSRVDVRGDGNTVFGGSNDNFGVTGANDVVNGGSGDAIWIGSNGRNAPASDRVNAVGDTVIISDNARVDVVGDRNNVIAGNNDNFGVTGNFEQISAGTGDGLWMSGNGGGEVGDKVTASSDTLFFGDNASQTSLYGSYDTVNGGRNDLVTITGSYDHSVFGVGSKVDDIGSADTLNGTNVNSGITEDINSNGGLYTDSGSPGCTPTWVAPTYTYEVVGEEIEFDEDGDEYVVPVYQQVQTGGGYYTSDPVVLNLTGGQVDTTARDGATTRFDMLNDGTLQQTAWVTPGEGLLVFDPQHASDVRSESALVGSLDSLAAMAHNSSGVLDAGNPLWQDLKVWVDHNGDAVAQPGELKTLDEIGIKAINLNAQAEQKDDHGNTIRATSTFVWTDGHSGNLASVDLAFNPSAPAPAPAPTPSLNRLVDAMAAFFHDQGTGDAANLLPAREPSWLGPVAANHGSWQRAAM